MDDDAFEPEEATSSNSKQSHLSAEALAGLASTEDFSSVQLRKGGGGEAVGVDLSLLPYRRDIMLLQVKYFFRTNWNFSKQPLRFAKNFPTLETWSLRYYSYILVFTNSISLFRKEQQSER